jgi:hypothetical protein
MKEKRIILMIGFISKKGYFLSSKYVQYLLKDGRIAVVENVGRVENVATTDPC